MKKLSTAVKIRRMLVKNHSPKDIALKLNVNVQAVYNMRYKMKQAAAATAPLAPLSRIVLDSPAPVRRPRGRPRKNPLPIEASARPAPEFTGTITCAAPEPKSLMLWERVRRWWRG